MCDTSEPVVASVERAHAYIMNIITCLIYSAKEQRSGQKSEVLRCTQPTRPLPKSGQRLTCLGSLSHRHGAMTFLNSKMDRMVAIPFTFIDLMGMSAQIHCMALTTTCARAGGLATSRTTGSLSSAPGGLGQGLCFNCSPQRPLQGQLGYPQGCPEWGTTEQAGGLCST